jgi:hypothetical protein
MGGFLIYSETVGKSSEVGLWNDLPCFHNGFQVGKVQICFGNDRFFGLSFFNNYTGMLGFCLEWVIHKILGILMEKAEPETG